MAPRAPMGVPPPRAPPRSPVLCALNYRASSFSARPRVRRHKVKSMDLQGPTIRRKAVQCEMAVGGKSEVSRPGNFARQQARRHPKKQNLACGWAGASAGMGVFIRVFGVLQNQINCRSPPGKLKGLNRRCREFESPVGREFSPHRLRQVLGSILAAGMRILREQ